MSLCGQTRPGGPFWFDDNALALESEFDLVAGLQMERLANLPRDNKLPLAGKRGGAHPRSLTRLTSKGKKEGQDNQREDEGDETFKPLIDRKTGPSVGIQAPLWEQMKKIRRSQYSVSQNTPEEAIIVEAIVPTVCRSTGP
jgi:hypothetical protein